MAERQQLQGLLKHHGRMELDVYSSILQKCQHQQKSHQQHKSQQQQRRQQREGCQQQYRSQQYQDASNMKDAKKSGDASNRKDTSDSQVARSRHRKLGKEKMTVATAIMPAIAGTRAKQIYQIVIIIHNLFPKKFPLQYSTNCSLKFTKNLSLIRQKSHEYFKAFYT